MKIVKTSGSGAVSINFTNMIDIIFNLLIFFVLTCQFQSLEIEDVALPVSLTAEIKDYASFRNVVVNIVHPDQPAIVLMGHEMTAQELTEHLTDLNEKAAADGMSMNVILRADEGIPYGEVARVMLAAGRAKIPGWWIEADVSDNARNAAKAGGGLANASATAQKAP
jgi:biopolymer transport protein TolR